MGAKIDVNKVTIGDVIIVTDKNKVGSSSNRIHIEEYAPYYVSDIGVTAIYIEVKGKNFMIFDSDFVNIEFLYSKNDLMINNEESVALKVGDNVVITDVTNIKNASELGFTEKVRYEITQITKDFIYITNDRFELLIEGLEMNYVKHESVFVDNDFQTLMGEIYQINKSNEIDRLLDSKSYENLKEL